MSNSILVKKSFQFAILTITIYKSLVADSKEYVMSRQLLKSGTSVGANVREAQNAESKADFVHKLAIAQKECDETLYWLELLFETDFIKEDIYHNLHSNAEELIKMIKSAIITTKQNYLK
jgi:four helix bundle protein